MSKKRGTLQLWVGYAIRMHYDDFVINNRRIMIAASILFLLLLPFWTPEIQEMYGGARIKITDVILGDSDPLLLLKLAYRIVIGVCGSVAIIAVFHSIKSVPNLVSVIGGSTAAIYILQSLLLEYLIGTYFAPYAFLVTEMPQWVVFAILFPTITLLLIAICIGIKKMISKSKIISAFILGDTSILKR